MMATISWVENGTKDYMLADYTLYIISFGLMSSYSYTILLYQESDLILIPISGGDRRKLSKTCCYTPPPPFYGHDKNSEWQIKWTSCFYNISID
jgi:hypothetical protein